MPFKFNKKDPTRIRSFDYFVGLLQIKLGVVVVPMTAADRKELEEEFLLCADYWKGVPSAVNDLISLGIKAASAIAFLHALYRQFGIITTPLFIIRSIRQSVSNQWVHDWITRYAARYGVGGRTLAFGGDVAKRGSVLLIVLVTVPHILVLISNNQVPKALGEVMKTLGALACAPAAFFDLLDSVAGMVLPQWFLDNPVVRMARCLNPLTGVSTAAENLTYVGMLFGFAVQNRWGDFEKAIGDWVAAMDKQPQAVYTELSADFAVVLDRLLPGCVSRFDAFGLTYASIRNLADHTRQVRAAQAAGALP